MSITVWHKTESHRIHLCDDFFSVLKLMPHDRYNKLSRTIRELAKRVSEIDAKEPFRTEMSALLLEKLYVLGLIPTKWDLNNAVNISASSFCRRRLPVVMVRSKYLHTFYSTLLNESDDETQKPFYSCSFFSPTFVSQITCPNI